MKSIYVTMLAAALVMACKQEEAQKTVETPEGVSWAVPNGWIEEPLSSQFRRGQYRLPMVPGDQEDATCVVYYFRGQGGGVEANIDRWCGQFLQPDERNSRDVAQIRSEVVNGLKRTYVDLSGTYLFAPTPMAAPTTEKPGFRLLAAIIETQGGPWFVKLVGPEHTVEKWHESFLAFVRSFSEATHESN